MAEGNPWSIFQLNTVTLFLVGHLLLVDGTSDGELITQRISVTKEEENNITQQAFSQSSNVKDERATRNHRSRQPPSSSCLFSGLKYFGRDTHLPAWSLILPIHALPLR